MIPLRDANPTRRLPVVTIALIVVNVVVYLFVQVPARGTDVVDVDGSQVRIDGELRFNLEHAAIPCEVTQGEPLTLTEIGRTFVQGDDTACEPDATGPELFSDKNVYLALVVSIFLHGGLLHLAGNMLFLWVFGDNIEDHLGPVRFLAFFLLAGVASSLAHVAVQPASTVPVVGASGAIAGVMGAYLVWFPRAPIHTLFFLIIVFWRRIEARWVLLFWFVSQFFLNPNTGVAWVAHVGGFVFGVVVGVAARSSEAVRRLVWRSEFVTSRGWDETGGYPSSR
ncbi:MAG: rhomboid family intramembrane serine protease [Acidimicrobiales bacterium]|nr:rhomboid family intramembrane serine protease [Acidimicrobiales bacterium]